MREVVSCLVRSLYSSIASYLQGLLGGRSLQTSNDFMGSRLLDIHLRASIKHNAHENVAKLRLSARFLATATSPPMTTIDDPTAQTNSTISHNVYRGVYAEGWRLIFANMFLSEFVGDV